MMNEDRKRSGWVRMASAGMELAAAVVGFVLLGYWIDQQRGSGPKWVLILGLLGIVGGLYNFLRSALVESRKAAERDDSKSG
jgi:F0F1-type ATP synthase assembly protein I